MKSIAVIGTGFVGQAVIEGMRHAFDIYSYDKFYGIIEYKKNGSLVSYGPEVESISWIVSKTDGPIFVCVPTPMNQDGSCNTTIVEEVVGQIATNAKRFNKKVIVVIKSTIIPGTTLRLNHAHPNIHICFNPEFLTERNYIDDFKHQDHIIVGGPHEGTSVLKQMYEQAYPGVPITKTSSTIAEMVKYITNCFLATKVSFANEMQQICQKMDVDFDKVIEYATKDKRLGTSHWAVPGPMPADDGSNRLLPGFSGSCLCKDLNAMIYLAKQLKIDPKVMEATWNKNLEVRPEKDWEQLKGRAVVDLHSL